MHASLRLELGFRAAAAGKSIVQDSEAETVRAAGEPALPDRIRSPSPRGGVELSPEGPAVLGQVLA